MDLTSLLYGHIFSSLAFIEKYGNGENSYFDWQVIKKT